MSAALKTVLHAMAPLDEYVPTPCPHCAATTTDCECEHQESPVRCQECWHYLEQCECDDECLDDAETLRADSLGYKS